MNPTALISALILAQLTTGCQLGNKFLRETGSGVTESEVREVRSFKEIELSGTGNVNVKCGAETALVVTADDNLLKSIRTVVDNECLEIYPAKKMRPSVRPSFEITTESLEAISIAGAGQFTVNDVSGDELDIEIAGAADIKVFGIIDNVDIEIAGSGDVDLSELVANHVTIEIAGSGTVCVHAMESLDVSIAGSGDVSYIGDPKIKKSIVGSGAIHKTPNVTKKRAKKESSDNSEGDDSATNE